MPEGVPPIVDQQAPLPGEPWRVVWTRGEGLTELAEMIADEPPVRADADLKQSCIQARANVLVTATAGSFDLAGTVVPHDFDPTQQVPAVIGAIGTGPHSPFVAETTRKIAKGLGAEAVLVTMEQPDSNPSDALDLLAGVAALAPDATTRSIQADTAAEMIGSLPDGALLVLGAPGGSWWQRQFFGPGRKLIHAAHAGAVVVRSAPRRCFHPVGPLTGLGTLMRLGDAVAVAVHSVTPVVDDGRVVGLVRLETMQHADPQAAVGTVMEPAVALNATDPISDTGDVASHFADSPIPVVDDRGQLLGGIQVGATDRPS